MLLDFILLYHLLIYIVYIIRLDGGFILIMLYYVIECFDMILLIRGVIFLIFIIRMLGWGYNMGVLF
jgi:hypothetical protein